ncbi:MAG TPA: hypothetical protein V6C76_04025 [Drouetiella sp.]
MTQATVPDTSLNDAAWRRICGDTPLLAEIETQGYSYINAKSLKTIGQREPRLMAKLDSLSDRPKVFEEHSLNILPSERGTYIVFRDVKNLSYYSMPSQVQSVPPEQHISRVELESFDSIPKTSTYTEFQAIDVAYLSGLLTDFCAVGELQLTTRGRMSSGEFDLVLPDIAHTVRIKNAQIEIDSAYEGSLGIPLIEAKTGFRADFNVRQLQYPYLFLSSVSQKKILPILLSYSNGQYQLSQFEVGDQFGALSLVQQSYFVINEPSVVSVELERLIRSIPVEPEPLDAPLPQANDLNKVIDVICLIEQGVSELQDITETLGVVERQAYYYGDAARYLGYVGAKRAITEDGIALAREKSRLGRVLLLLRKMLTRPVMRDSILLLESRGFSIDAIESDDLANIIRTHRTDLTGDTIVRRASTVRNWLRWLLTCCAFN